MSNDFFLQQVYVDTGCDCGNKHRLVLIFINSAKERIVKSVQMNRGLTPHNTVLALEDIISDINASLQ